MKVSPDRHSQMHLAILGFGREGKSVLKFLKRMPRYRPAEISILDQKFDKNYLKNLAQFDLIFRPPGVPYNLSALVKARKRGVKFSSATRLFFEHCPAKANIVRYQKSACQVFFFQDSPRARLVARQSRGRKIPVNPKHFNLFSPTDLRLVGEHNFRNAVMAATVAAQLGVSSSMITRVMKRFRGLPHRLQFVRRIGQMSFYDDSAATNPGAAAAALRSFPAQSLVLIAGGRGKGLDYAPLTAAIKHFQTKAVLLFGADRKVLALVLGRSDAEIILVETLVQAVKKLFALTKFFKPAVVLLSPGATSFDQFGDYIERGEKFQQLVHQL